MKEPRSRRNPASPRPTSEANLRPSPGAHRMVGPAELAGVRRLLDVWPQPGVNRVDQAGYGLKTR